MWFACECLLTGLSVDEVPCRVLGIAEQAVQRNGERSSFLHLFEHSWPALHVPVGFAPELGRGPSFFSNSHRPPFFFYTCFSKVSFSPTALLFIYLEKESECLWLIDWLLSLECQDDRVCHNHQMCWKLCFAMHWLYVVSKHIHFA